MSRQQGRRDLSHTGALEMNQRFVEPERFAQECGFTRILILATTWWPAPALLARAFAAMGIEVSALCPAGHPLRATRAVARALSCSARDPLRALSRAVMLCRPDLVIPCDDRTVEHCRRLYPRAMPDVQALLRRSLGAIGSYDVLASRSAVLRLAEIEGIRVPRTFAVAPQRAADIALPFPFVVKNSGSWGGAGVRIVQNSDEAEKAVAALGRPIGLARALKRGIVNRDGFGIASWREAIRPEVVAQAFIAGTPANIAIAAHEGEMLSALAVRVSRTQGATGPASIVEVIAHPEMEQAARRLVARLGLSGFHGLDFVLDDEGAAWLLEVNPRATQLCHFAAPGRASLADALVRGPEHRPAEAPAPPGTHIAFFPQAWRCDPGNPLLRSAAHEVPWDEPELVADLMLPPWPNRSRLAQLWQAVVENDDANAAWARPLTAKAPHHYGLHHPTVTLNSPLLPLPPAPGR